MRVLDVASEGTVTHTGGGPASRGFNSDAKRPAAAASDNALAGKMLDALMRRAIKLQASAIHIEPQEKSVHIRYRVDGALGKATAIPHKAMPILLPYIKALAHVPHHDTVVPQSGKFKFPVQDHIFTLQISTLPVIDGEKLVIHVNNESEKIPLLEDLGYQGQSLQALSAAITQPGGMVLITGPADSGKSTSLYSIAKELNKVGSNITTIEDAIHRSIHGVNQFQMNPRHGMTALQGLQAAINQDPDVIMVDGVHDAPAARLAIESAAARHLVFSTFYTDSAASGLVHLQGLGIEPYLIASTVRASSAQRLVRRLCSHCKQEYPLEKFKSDSILQSLALKASKLGKNSPAKLWRPSLRGCNACNHSGFSGRIGVYEVLPVTPTIQKLITGNAVPSAIHDQAVKEGMRPLLTDALAKAAEGLTTIEEVLRISHTLPATPSKQIRQALAG